MNYSSVAYFCCRFEVLYRTALTRRDAHTVLNENLFHPSSPSDHSCASVSRFLICPCPSLYRRQVSRGLRRKFLCVVRTLLVRTSKPSTTTGGLRAQSIWWRLLIFIFNLLCRSSFAQILQMKSSSSVWWCLIS